MHTIYGKVNNLAKNELYKYGFTDKIRLQRRPAQHRA